MPEPFMNEREIKFAKASLATLEEHLESLKAELAKEKPYRKILVDAFRDIKYDAHVAAERLFDEVFSKGEKINLYAPCSRLLCDNCGHRSYGRKWYCNDHRPRKSVKAGKAEKEV